MPTQKTQVKWSNNKNHVGYVFLSKTALSKLAPDRLITAYDKDDDSAHEVPAADLVLVAA